MAPKEKTKGGTKSKTGKKAAKSTSGEPPAVPGKLATPRPAGASPAKGTKPSGSPRKGAKPSGSPTKGAKPSGSSTKEATKKPKEDAKEATDVGEKLKPEGKKPEGKKPEGKKSEEKKPEGKKPEGKNLKQNQRLRRNQRQRKRD